MKIISHGHQDDPSREGTDPAIARMRAELGAFELGRFLVENLGLNGRWTSYVLMHPERGRLTNTSSDGTPRTELEAWLLDRCPIILATQERFRIFRELTQPLLRPGMQLASLPAGLMDDLLTLDYNHVPGVVLSGIDLDPDSLREAEQQYHRMKLPVQAVFEQRDAWELKIDERWDLLTSNGLNIYVREDEACTDFYRRIARALKPGGLFVVSFITPPDQWRPHDPGDLARQRFLFTDVIAVKWSCFRDESLTRRQLDHAGFEVLTVRYDTQRMFPALVARKV